MRYTSNIIICYIKIKNIFKVETICGVVCWLPGILAVPSQKIKRKNRKEMGGEIKRMFSCRSSSWIDDGIFSGGAKTCTALSPKGYRDQLTALWEHVNGIDGRARLIYLQPFNLTIRGTCWVNRQVKPKRRSWDQHFFFSYGRKGKEKKDRDQFGTKIVNAGIKCLFWLRSKANLLDHFQHNL